MNPVAAYKQTEGISLSTLAVRLGLKSKGHASDLVRGRKPLTVALAKRLEPLCGRPWHELIDG